MRNQLPSNIICPETGLIYCDPVTIEGISEEYVYERAMITHWMRLGKRECPYGNNLTTDKAHPFIPATKVFEAASHYTKSNPSTCEAKRFKSYWNNELKWRNELASSELDNNAYINGLIAQYQQNCYNANCQYIASYLVNFSFLSALMIYGNQLYPILTISTALNFYLALGTALLFMAGCFLWMWPEHTQSFNWLIGDSTQSVTTAECNALTSLWNPQTLETCMRFPQNENSHENIYDNITEYAHTFSQLVLGTSKLSMFNVSNEKAIPTVINNMQSADALDKHTNTLEEYHQRKVAIRQLKRYEKNPELLNLPNAIPLFLQPINFIIHLLSWSKNLVVSSPTSYEISSNFTNSYNRKNILEERPEQDSNLRPFP